MAKHKRITFDAFTLDTANELLWKDSERIVLRPKTFALLRYLIEHPGQLETKQELLSALWEDLNIGDEALKHCVAEIRKALDDSARSPRYIETVFRRGYRFIGTTNAKQISNGDSRAEVKRADQHPAAGSPKLVGRQSELARLHHSLAKAIGGVRQVVFISGEQGIGKTSLVDAFLDTANEQSSKPKAQSAARALIARGQCIKSHGAGEAYMPVLEAFTGLCGTPDRRRIAGILRRHAPLWLAQMPSQIGTADLQKLVQSTSGATRERMLREMAEALEILTAETPLILVLEDLQWSDFSTLDLISYWAQRRGPARLLLIGTFRPLEIMTNDHPLRSVKDDLQTRQLGEEISLPSLDKTAIGEYLGRRFRDHRFPSEMAFWIQQRTGGSPLFMVNMLDHMESHGFIIRHGRYWELNTTLENAALSVPPTIQQTIERQMERCTPQEKRLLMAGSVEGVEFSVTGVAAALGEKVDRSEERCRRLAERRQFLQPAGFHRMEDGRQTACYSFTHVLYQNTCYQLLPDDLRVRLHRRLAEYMEETNGAGRLRPDARLAMHFDRGMEQGRALKYYRQAADKANSRYAGHEAQTLATRGLQLLNLIPEDAERMDHEMGLQIALGTALMSLRGSGSEEVNRIFGRAHEIFRQLDKSRQSGKRVLLSSALYGLWTYHWAHAQYAEARELAEKLLQLAENERDPLLLHQAHHSMGVIMMDHGEFTDAYEHLAQGTGVVTRCCAALTLWNLGYPDQARKSIEETIVCAAETGNPKDLIFVNLGAARVHLAQREYQKALDRAQASLDFAISNELVEVWTAPMRSVHGWALSKLGQIHNGLEQTRQALEVFRTIGYSNLLPLLAAIFAEISMDAGRIEDGLAAVDEALHASRNTAMQHHDAEIYRIKGELVLQQALNHQNLCKDKNRFAEAESCYIQAIEVARQQQSRSLELRAATSLARLLQRQNRHDEARKHLMPIYTWFTEGHDTPDLQDARELLQELS
jgi:DNA-binding winged helix-turn-helix (wHTH) protein/tetratricopeptide (TPR) repeat protein